MSKHKFNKQEQLELYNLYDQITAFQRSLERYIRHVAETRFKVNEKTQVKYDLSKMEIIIEDEKE